jgi:glycine C-acetyltransferase
MLEKDTLLLDRLTENTHYFRSAMKQAGFDIVSGTHPIIPIMLYDDHLAQNMASQLLEENIFVVGFSYPVVPKGKARIRVQMSAALNISQIDSAVTSFIKVGKRLGVL